MLNKPPISPLTNIRIYNTCISKQHDHSIATATQYKTVSAQRQPHHKALIGVLDGWGRDTPAAPLFSIITWSRIKQLGKVNSGYLDVTVTMCSAREGVHLPTADTHKSRSSKRV